MYIHREGRRKPYCGVKTLHCSTHCNTLQRSASHTTTCNTRLYNTAVSLINTHHIATHTTLRHTPQHLHQRSVQYWCQNITLQPTLLQHAATRRNTHCNACNTCLCNTGVKTSHCQTRCNTLQHSATHTITPATHVCAVLQCQYIALQHTLQHTVTLCNTHCNACNTCL